MFHGIECLREINKYCTSYKPFVYVSQNVVSKMCHGRCRRVVSPEARLIFAEKVHSFEISR